MSDETLENVTPKNETEVTVNTEENETPKNDDVSELKARLDKLVSDNESLKKDNEDLKKYGENQKTRAEKAEGKTKNKGVSETKDNSNQGEISINDAVELLAGKVHKDDFDKVVKWSKFNNQTVGEALKDPTLQVILRESNEKRVTSEATSNRGTRPSSSASGDTLLKQVRQGIFPEDDADIGKVADAFIKSKHPNIGKK